MNPYGTPKFPSDGKITFPGVPGLLCCELVRVVRTMKKFAFVTLLAFATSLTIAQMQDHHPDAASAQQSDLSATTQAMSHGHHHEDHDHMTAHMHMSALRDPQPGDQERAEKIVEEARQSLERYRDYNVALADGYRIFLPNVPQKMYHFTNWLYAMGSAISFDPTKPTSLLYEKTPDGYKLIGAMYTAPVNFTEDQINERVPLSVAQWHQHVNMCQPPRGNEIEMLGKHARFGLNGSISTRAECEAAGGTFRPHVFGWMVHLYPWEKTPDEIWSVERQLDAKPSAQEHHHDHGGMTD